MAFEDFVANLLGTQPRIGVPPPVPIDPGVLHGLNVIRQMSTTPGPVSGFVPPLPVDVPTGAPPLPSTPMPNPLAMSAMTPGQRRWAGRGEWPVDIAQRLRSGAYPVGTLEHDAARGVVANYVGQAANNNSGIAYPGLEHARLANPRTLYEQALFTHAFLQWLAERDATQKA
jgi:hypothetical protein